jgi:hypothetical protein
MGVLTTKIRTSKRMTRTIIVTSPVLAVAALFLLACMPKTLLSIVKSDPALQICPNGMSLKESGLTAFSCPPGIEVLFESEKFCSLSD